MAWSSPRTFVTGETVTAAHLNQEIRDNLDALNPLDSVGATSWSPTLMASTANPTTSSVSGRYWRVGPVVSVWARWAIDTAGDGSGTYFVTLPIAAAGVIGSDAAANSGQVVGSFRVVDATSSANNQGGQVVVGSALTVARFALGDAGGNLVTNANPFVWAVGDVLTFWATYPAA